MTQNLALRARKDLAWVLGLSGATFALASRFEWHERLTALSLGLERWQVDELPLTLTLLSLGLAWYARRRRNESLRLAAHNRNLAHQMIEVQESERRALARELHDELAQHCTALRIEAACLHRSADPVQMAEAAARAAATATHLQDGVHRLLKRLRPAELDELGLVAALQALAQTWRSRGGLHCTLQCEGELAGLGAAVDTGVYRIVQEAGLNVLRHAEASAMTVELRADSSQLTMFVHDDGRGFDTSRSSTRLGLLGASERAAMLGGLLVVESAVGAGTRLRLTLPRT